jgi:hypothetical protein
VAFRCSRRRSGTLDVRPHLLLYERSLRAEEGVGGPPLEAILLDIGRCLLRERVKHGVFGDDVGKGGLDDVDGGRSLETSGPARRQVLVVREESGEGEGRVVKG